MIAAGKRLHPCRFGWVSAAVWAAVCFLHPAAVAFGAEFEALQISQNIAARHLPFGTILDPAYNDSNAVIGYTRCGDSAIWTGHYLAAEAFRYKVTRSAEALQNVKRALAGVRSLVDVTGENRLARCLMPADSVFTPGLLDEESQHGAFRVTYNGKPYFWVGNTSRDQYCGVMFGLGVAWEFVEEAEVRAGVKDLVTRLLDRLLDDGWMVRMPDGGASTVFWGRADQQLAFLQVGRLVNPDRFSREYRSHRFWYWGGVGWPVSIETLNRHDSYFKFNLAAINFFHLIRHEEDGFYKDQYLRAYRTFRRAVEKHGNAHFNMIDRAIGAPDSVRDAETRVLLDLWLQRPRRDEWLDWRGVYPACGSQDRACEPIPVDRRIRTDFLWQRSPFLLYGGGSGRVESAAIDYILPYWMARYFGVL